MSQVRKWQDAQTLADLGECTALWLEDRLDPIPARRPITFEGNTDKLRTLLVQLNRSGRLITVQAQPGCTDMRGGRRMGGVAPFQRAAVMGFMPASQGGLLSSVFSRHPGLTVRFEKAGLRTRRADIAVAADSLRQPSGFYGTLLSRHAIGRHYKGMSPKLIAALQGAFQVTIVDTEWGRNELIWPRLRRLAEMS